MHPSESLSEIADLEMFWELDEDAVDYCKNLESHEYMKFLQQIINTLAKEEEAAAIGSQLCLPI
ncbi:hypothetical protein ACEYW6_35845 [Nostoc sp. UIC 10607]|uniref:hypothetical protein n=1 Tax=Nostoc sp. UIC 10607 TaxID=3045935 RepID=UPI0039A0C85C